MEPISKAISLKTELDFLRPLSPEQETRIMQKFRLDWNYHSNRLEGNSLTFGETKALILFGITAQGKPLKDHLEIEGHNEAIEWVLGLVKEEDQLTEKFIRELHTLLLKESYSVNAITAEGKPTKKRIEVGKYKSQPNHVLTATGEMFYFATPEEALAKMEELMNWYRGKLTLNDINPVFLAAEFHYKFIRIHPFNDGNGRTARILMNFILLKFGFPPVIIKTEDKHNYFSVLQLADAGQIEPFINYIAENLVRSLELMIRGAKGEDIEEPDDFDKELALLEQRLKGNKSHKIEKSEYLVRELFEKSIVPLFIMYDNDARKFDTFYEGVSHFWQSGNYLDNRVPIAIQKIRKNLSIETNSFKMFSSYRSFKFSTYNEFSHLSEIEIILGDFAYVVKINKNSTRFEKKYREQLSDDEVREIVRVESKRHRNFIEGWTKE